MRQLWTTSGMRWFNAPNMFLCQFINYRCMCKPGWMQCMESCKVFFFFFVDHWTMHLPMHYSSFLGNKLRRYKVASESLWILQVHSFIIYFQGHRMSTHYITVTVVLATTEWKSLKPKWASWFNVITHKGRLPSIPFVLSLLCCKFFNDCMC